MNKKGRGKSQNVKNEVRETIIYIKALHDDWSPKRIENYLKNHKYELNLKLNEIPVDRTIRNIIVRGQSTLAETKIRKNTNEFNNLESPWNIGVASPFNFTPEAISLVTSMQSWLKKIYPDEIITIRKALWISRLYKIADIYTKMLDMKVVKKKGIDIHEIWRRYLWEKTEVYSFYETIWQLSGKSLPPDTADLDAELYTGSVLETVDTDIGKGILKLSIDNRVGFISVNKKDGVK